MANGEWRMERGFRLGIMKRRKRMDRKRSLQSWYGVLMVALVVVLVGCGSGQATPASGGGEAGYTSAVLDTAYDGALDVSDQLALGTILLEETGDAVTSEQATALLPLWQAVQGGVLQGDAELNGVLAQVERTMTAEQLAAIAGMQLTQEDLQAWMQEQGSGMGGGPMADGGGQVSLSGESAEPPAGFAGEGEMSLQMATWQSGAVVLNPLIELLGQRAQAGGGRAVDASLVASAETSALESTPESAAESAPAVPSPSESTLAATPAPSVAEAAVTADTPDTGVSDDSEPAVTADQNVSESITQAEPAVATSSQEPASTAEPSTETDEVVPAEGSVEGLTRFEDTSPAPPFTIEVSTVRLVGDMYEVLGTVRNDGSETYEGVGVFATFYTLGSVSESNGPPPKGDPDDPNADQAAEDDDGNGSRGEMLYPHGPVDALCTCSFLEPGEECSFQLEIYARDYVGYGLHAEGQPISYFQWHEPATVVLSDVSASNDGVGYVRITGTVTNENTFAVKSATIGGTLIDDNGQIVSVGTTTVLGDIEPGASASFDLRVEYEPYARYEVYVQGARY